MLRTHVGKLWLCMAAAIALTSSARAGDDTAKFNGKWKADFPYNGAIVTIASVHDGTGYKNYAILPNGAMPVGDGKFSAADGKWTVTSAQGNDSGTYNFKDDKTAVCKDAAGVTVTWIRDDSPLPAIIGQQGAAPAPAAGLAPEVRADVEAKIKAGDYEAAWRAMFQAQAWKSRDPSTIALDSTIRLGLGQLDVARTEAALVMQFSGELDNADALSVHAKAAAAMGYLRQAKDDLQVYSTLRPDGAAALQKAVDEYSASKPAGCAPDQITAQSDKLLKMAADGTDAESLVQQATIVFKGENNIRKVEFDTYRQRKRELTQAAAADPKNAKKLAALAQYIFDQSWEIHGDSGSGYKPINRSYRCADPAAEQQEAIALCDQALQLDKMNVQAYAVEADALISLGKDDQAVSMINVAMQIDANNPELLRMYSAMVNQAAWSNSNAGDELSTQTITEDSENFYIHTRSDADLAQARVYNDLAAKQSGMGLDALQAAVNNTRGTAAGFYYAAVLAHRGRDEQTAATNMYQAVTMEPDNAYYRIFLGELDSHLGAIGEASSFQQYSAADNLVQTSATKLVNLTWEQLRRRDYDSARKTLDQAIKIDPVDPHVLAYLGFLLVGQSDDKRDMDKTAAYLLAAWSLEQTRLRMVGIRAKSTISTCGANDFGLEAALAVEASQRLLKLNRADQAYSMLKIVLEDATRVDSSQMDWPVKTTVLPNLDVQTKRILGPGGINMVSVRVFPLTYWLRTCHKLASSALTAMGKPDVAAQEDTQAGMIKDLGQDSINPTLRGNNIRGR